VRTPEAEMPQFAVGDLVSPKVATPKRVGTVVRLYDLEGETRCVVRFEDGSESVFFASELVPANQATDQAGGSFGPAT